jgi:hypothetical protein
MNAYWTSSALSRATFRQHVWRRRARRQTAADFYSRLTDSRGGGSAASHDAPTATGPAPASNHVSCLNQPTQQPASPAVTTLPQNRLLSCPKNPGHGPPSSPCFSSPAQEWVETL